MSYSYSAIESAKNGSLIPVRQNISFCSKYNPEREGEQFATSCAGDFFVVLGLCGGYHINALAHKLPHAPIIVVENTAEDFAFLQKIPAAKQAVQLPNVITTTADALSRTLLAHFLPAKYDTLSVRALRVWEQTFATETETIRTSIQKTLQVISADFSVQRYFGGIWQRNILVNLRTAAHRTPATIRLPIKKTAAIIAAGPSLDESAKTIAAQREAFYVIATDTGYRALLRRGIISDAVVTTDAQMVSHAHFFDLAPHTLCILDCTAHTAAFRICARQNPLLVMQTGHPLSQFASHTQTTALPMLHAGSGTVTIAAASFALYAGFTRLQFFGADFGYTNGKAYARGSYLDDLYNATSSRIHPAETTFNALMFRTPLFARKDGTLTTELLDSYRSSLEDFMHDQGCTKTAENCYSVTAPLRTAEPIRFVPFDYDAFRNAYATETDATAVTTLPYIAWLKRKNNPQEDFATLSRLAYKKTLEYTKAL